MQSSIQRPDCPDENDLTPEGWCGSGQSLTSSGTWTRPPPPGWCTSPTTGPAPTSCPTGDTGNANSFGSVTKIFFQRGAAARGAGGEQPERDGGDARRGDAGAGGGVQLQGLHQHPGARQQGQAQRRRWVIELSTNLCKVSQGSETRQASNFMSTYCV